MGCSTVLSTLLHSGSDASQRSCTALQAVAADAAGQRHVFGHDGNALGMDGAQVAILKQANRVRLRGLLRKQYMLIEHT